MEPSILQVKLSEFNEIKDKTTKHTHTHTHNLRNKKGKENPLIWSFGEP
jgi:hypothetical protein